MMKKIKTFLTILLVMLLTLQTTSVFALEVLEDKKPIEETTVSTESFQETEEKVEEQNSIENTILTEKTEEQNIATNTVLTEKTEEQNNTTNTILTEKTEEHIFSSKEPEEKTTDLEADKEVETEVVGAEYYDGNISYNYSSWSNEVTVVARGKYITEANIPSYIFIDGANRKVTTVEGFNDCTNLRKVTLPSTLTTIDYSAFRGCTSLTSITIPSSVTRIDDYAFANTGLTSIVIPNSVTELGYNAFENCTSLASVTLSNKINYIEKETFYNCSKLTAITIPNSVTKIGSSAFSKSGLKSITIPASVTEMYTSYDSGAFQDCKALTTANILAKITHLPESIFEGCTALTNVTLPNTLTQAGNHAFEGCTSLKTISLPNNLKNISREMFYGCSNLTSIKLPDNLEEVGGSAFAYCSKLTSISFPYKVISLDYGGYNKGTFEGCTSLDSIYFTKSIQEVDDYVFYGLDYCTIYGYEGSAAKTIAEENGYRYIQLTPVTSIKVSGNKTVVKGQSTTLKTTVSPSNAYQKGVIWSSSNTSVATVDGNGKVTGIKTGTATITAMAKDGTGVRGTFNVTVSLTELPFTDVAGNAWYYEAVKYCYKNNIISGTSSTTFSPNTLLTRGMLVTILYRMEGQPAVSGKPKFPDVQNSKDYYYKAVKWATDKKVVSGYNNGKFGPNDNITREDLAVILNRYAKFKGKNTSQTNNLSAFSDRNKVSSYATSQVKWAVGAGVISGNANGTLNPKGKTTRAEAAAMLEKYCKKVGR